MNRILVVIRFLRQIIPLKINDFIYKSRKNWGYFKMNDMSTNNEPVEIFNSLGQKFLNTSLDIEGSLSIQHLDSCIYFIKTALEMSKLIE